MSKEKPRNLVASVQSQLRNRAKEHGDDFQLTLTRYGLERLLYRLSKSPHRRTFVLKGAMLFQLWTDQTHRSTRDIDFLGKGPSNPQRFEQIVREICDQEVEDDGLNYDAKTVKAEQIKENEEYKGLRIKLTANLGRIRVPIQIDIGFGDAVTPKAVQVKYPAILNFPAPEVSAYPKECVVSEKFQAMVMLGMANSRMKDFYDIWTLAKLFSFQGPILAKAIQATFKRRKTPIPNEPPLALRSEFFDDATKQKQWAAFCRKTKLLQPQIDLKNVIVNLQKFLMPPAIAIAMGTTFEKNWGGRSWQKA